MTMREFVSTMFVSGKGIEIGALDCPLPVAAGVEVAYVDQYDTERLTELYHRFDTPMVHVSHICNGETLAGIDDGSQDFVIANHFIEHAQDPIRTLENFFRVLKDRGVIYLAIPDKRFTFDKDRQVTDFAHIWRDYTCGPSVSYDAHVKDFVLFAEHKTPEELRERVEVIQQTGYSIHYHVWSQHELFEMFHALQNVFSFEIDLFYHGSMEALIVLRKNFRGMPEILGTTIRDKADATGLLGCKIKRHLEEGRYGLALKMVESELPDGPAKEKLRIELLKKIGDGA